MSKRIWFGAILLAVVAPFCFSGEDVRDYRPTAPELLESYRRADALPALVPKTTFGLSIGATWIGNTALVYRHETSPDAHEFLRVSVANGRSEPAFDHAALAQALSRELKRKISPTALPFQSAEVSEDLKTVSFAIGGTNYTWDVNSQSLEQGGGKPRTPSGRASPRNESSDGQYQFRILEGKLQVRRTVSETWADFATNGQIDRAVWVPNSHKLFAFRLIPGDRKKVYLLASSVGGTRAELRERLYDQPGDKLDEYQVLYLDGESKSVSEVNLAPIIGGGHPWAGPPDVTWIPDSQVAQIDFPIRGFQEYQVVELDGVRGTAKIVIDEKSPTFIDTPQNILRYVKPRDQYLWRSERDGWAHLYWVDRKDGSATQVTKGSWVVRSVEWIDESQQAIYFTGCGMRPGEDPYFIHFYRVNFDGKSLEDLTPAPANHVITWSENHESFIDSYSTIDTPPVFVLRSTKGLARELQVGNVEGLKKAGVPFPEPFVAKGRDGATDIYGIVVRPTNFDPKLRYPIIENIYAGPHDSFVPKSYFPVLRMQRLAELGFIVVQIDGMGTSNRGKKFHDVCWQNIVDAGFPDRILWMKALAKKYPQCDISRVGLYGTSAGGQNAGAGILTHPEFYKAAVASCGCHDNRIDKYWWNEQWMGYPVGPHYAQQSNITMAKQLEGQLLLIVGELDTNVPPESTYRLADALEKAGKEFELVVIPGADHTDGGVYGERKRRDFFVKTLLGVDSPRWNSPQ